MAGKSPSIFIVAIQLSHRVWPPHLLKLLACAAGSAAFQITPLGASETGLSEQS